MMSARRVELPDARGPSHGPGSTGARNSIAKTSTGWRAWPGVFWSHELGDRGEAAVFRFVPGQPGARALRGGARGVEFERVLGLHVPGGAGAVRIGGRREGERAGAGDSGLDDGRGGAALLRWDFRRVRTCGRRRGRTGRSRGRCGRTPICTSPDTEHPAPYSDAEAAARFDVQEAGYVPYASYRPPRAAIEIAQRKFQMPVEIQSAKPYYGLDENNYGDWNGQRGVRRRFEFETLYLDRDFTLAQRGDDAAGWRGKGRRADAVLGRESMAAGSEGRADLRQRRRQRHHGGALPVRRDRSVCERDAARGEGNGPGVGGGAPRDEGGNGRRAAVEVRLGDGLVGPLDGERTAAAVRCCRGTGCGATRHYVQYVWTFEPARTWGAGDGSGTRSRLTGR